MNVSHMPTSIISAIPIDKDTSFYYYGQVSTPLFSVFLVTVFTVGVFNHSWKRSWLSDFQVPMAIIIRSEHDGVYHIPTLEILGAKSTEKRYVCFSACLVIIMV